MDSSQRVSSMKTSRELVKTPTVLAAHSSSGSEPELRRISDNQCKEHVEVGLLNTNMGYVYTNYIALWFFPVKRETSRYALSLNRIWHTKRNNLKLMPQFYT